MSHNYYYYTVIIVVHLWILPVITTKCNNNLTSTFISLFPNRHVMNAQRAATDEYCVRAFEGTTADEQARYAIQQLQAPRVAVSLQLVTHYVRYDTSRSYDVNLIVEPYTSRSLKQV